MPDRLASAVQIETETLAAIETGRRDPDYRTLTRIARALEVSVADLLSAMEEENEEEDRG